MTTSNPPQPLRVGYVIYGDVADPMIASGVPHYLRRGFDSVTDVTIRDINARPSRWERLALKALSFRLNRDAWERNYLHGTLLPRARSHRRSRGVRAHQPLDAVLHVRTWYSALPTVPYASFIDATVSMVRGYDTTWDLSDQQFRREVEVEGDFYRNAAVVFTASHAAIDSLIQDYGVARENIVRIGAGTTLPRMATLDDAVAKARITSPNILFVGKDPDRKGLPELISGFLIAQKTHPELTLTIAGPVEQRPEYHLPGIEWLGLVGDKAQLAQLYARATIFALPAHRESFGLVIPEALAHGVPCIVSDTAELPYLIQDGKTGVVLDEISPHAIARAIEQLLADPAVYAATALAALEASKPYDWEVMAHTVRDELRKRLAYAQTRPAESGERGLGAR